MITIPESLQTDFEAELCDKQIPINIQIYYKKWLRYYLHFYRKYQPALARKENLSLILDKLKEKKQKGWQQEHFRAKSILGLARRCGS